MMADISRQNGERRGRILSSNAYGMHTTSDFQNLSADALTAIVKRGFEAQVPEVLNAANRIEAADYRSGYAVGLSGSAAPQEVPEGAEIKSVTMDDSGELKALPKDVASLIFISNQALVKDTTALGLLADSSRKMIIGSIQTLRNTVTAPIKANSGAGQTLRDGNPVFHVSRGNLAATGTAISVATLSAGRTSMSRQKDSQGNVLALAPKYLVVPPELQSTAEQIIAALQATKSSDVNPFAGKLEIITEPGLDSATAWYLVADPFADEGLSYAYLSGSYR